MASKVVPVWDRLNNPELKQLNDFRVFLFLVWRHLNLPKPTTVQLDIAKWLQHGPRDTNGRMIIEAFRGVGKTWITAAYVCWCLLLQPSLRILIVSKTGQKAQEILFLIKRLLKEMPALSHLNPEMTDRCTTEYFDVMGAGPDVQPSVKALGVDGQLPGNRADIIVPDDVETLQNCLTQNLREKLDRAVGEFDAILKPGGMILYLGTPQIEDSLYSRRANSGGYTIRIWPVRYPTVEQQKKTDYWARLAPMVTTEWTPEKAWKPLEPTRFDDADLNIREMSYGRSVFMLQYMLDTQMSNADKFPLRLRDMITMAFAAESDKCPASLIWSNDPQYCLMDPNLPLMGFAGDRFYRAAYVSDMWEPYERTVMAIDPSGRGKDETAFAVVSSFKGMLFGRSVGGYLDGYAPETLEALAKEAARMKVHRVRVESNFGDGAFVAMLKPYLQKYWPCEIVEEHSSQQKERKICDVLEPIIRSHRLVMLEEVIRQDAKAVEGEEGSSNYSMFYQMTRMTRERGAVAHEDRLEALAMAVSDHMEQLGQDVASTEATLQADIRRKFFEQYLESMDVTPQTVGTRGSMRYVH